MPFGRAAVLTMAALIVGLLLAGCKPNAQEPGPTATPTQGEAPAGDNPLTMFLVEQTDKRDMILGEMYMLLDAYRPTDGVGDDSFLAKSALTPFSEVDALLADVMMRSFYLRPQDGGYAYEAQGIEASLINDGQGYAYAARADVDEGAYQRQQAQMDAAGSRVDVWVFDKAAEGGEVETLHMRWLREGEAVVVQCRYTQDGGASYDVLRYQVDGATLAFALYAEADGAADEFALSAKGWLAEGYVTRGAYTGEGLEIENGANIIRIAR